MNSFSLFPESKRTGPPVVPGERVRGGPRRERVDPVVDERALDKMPRSGELGRRQGRRALSAGLALGSSRETAAAVGGRQESGPHTTDRRVRDDSY